MSTIVLWDIDGTLIRSNGGRVSVMSRVKLIPPPMFKEFPMAGDGEQLVGWGLRST